MISVGIDIGGTSVKAALLRDGAVVWTRRSAAYDRPGRERLVACVKELLADVEGRIDAVGLCVPGLLDREKRVVTQSINVPGLNDLSLDDFAGACFSECGGRSALPCLMTDAQAAAHDVYRLRQGGGRLLLLALGTGVGAAVWDEAGPLRVDGESAGHLGQMDVSLDCDAPRGPDGGRGSLEGYIGARALRERYGAEFAARVPTLATTEPPIRALARAIRIAHAIYRPHHVCITGGIGNLLGPMLPALREAICAELSRVARPGWTLGCGEDGYHAARGAAKWSEFSLTA